MRNRLRPWERVSGRHGDTGAASEDAAPTPDAATEVIRTADGIDLDARLFAADPDRVVILLHMYQTNQESWFPTARLLRDRGYSALTLDFRGYGASSGDVDPDYATRDIEAAVSFLHGRGYEHVVLVGFVGDAHSRRMSLRRPDETMRM